jgi:hypothetical protein
LTLAGRTALTAAQQYHRRLQEIDSGRDLLSTLPSGIDIADVFLDGASYAQASPEIPDRIIRYLFDSIESADVFRGVSPVALAGYLDEFYAVTTANGTIVKHVVDEDVVETLLAAPELRSGFIKQAQHDRVSLLSGDISFNYGSGLLMILKRELCSIPTPVFVASLSMIAMLQYSGHTTSGNR